MIIHIFLIMLFGMGSSSVLDSSSSSEEQLFKYIDDNQNKFVQTLKEWVAVESDSLQPKLRPEITKMINIAAEKLKALGADVTLFNLTVHQVIDGHNYTLPPVILAKLGEDPHKPTVCFYGHVDVMPAKKEDGWKTDPYNLTEEGGNLHGRGATDNKGPVLAWIHAVSAFQNKCIELPVNIKFLIEGMEEALSIGLEEVIEKEKDNFFADVDFIVISDNTWLTIEKPALTYGARGSISFFVEVKSGEKDLHSGAVGGIIHEPMFDLIALLGSLVDSSGSILIPGIFDNVTKFTEEEKDMYKLIEFNLEDHKVNVGVKKFRFDDKEEILSHSWRFPSLSIHGIEGAYYEQGLKTVIPSRVIGKFSIRLVPDMNCSAIEHQVKQYLKDKFSERGSSNNLTVTVGNCALPWLSDFNGIQYKAACKAIKKVFKKDPDMIRDGSTIPVAQMLQNITKKSVMMFPIGAADDGEHSQKEKISRYNYIEGTKVFASFLLELPREYKKNSSSEP